jgi:uncharacterized Tic20 family protein
MTEEPEDPTTPGASDEREAEVSTGPTVEERNWAMGAHVGSFIAAWFALGLVAPLVVMLTKGNDSAYVRRHAVESLNFQINALIWIAVSVVLFLVLIGIFMLIAYAIFYLIVVIMGGVAASQGREYRYPMIIRFVS